MVGFLRADDAVDGNHRNHPAKDGARHPYQHGIAPRQAILFVMIRYVVHGLHFSVPFSTCTSAGEPKTARFIRHTQLIVPNASARHYILTINVIRTQYLHGVISFLLVLRPSAQNQSGRRLTPPVYLTCKNGTSDSLIVKILENRALALLPPLAGGGIV